MVVLWSRTVWLGQFWKHSTPVPSRRDLQLRFFHILSKQLKARGHRMVHAGMHSGGLDMYASAGQRVVQVLIMGKIQAALN